MLQKTRIHDEYGQEIYPVSVFIVSPVEHIIKARQIASEHMKNVENVIDWQPEEMLPVALSNTGELPETHYCCIRNINTDMRDAMVKSIASKQYEWCAKSFAVDLESADKFCVCGALGGLQKIA